MPRIRYYFVAYTDHFGGDGRLAAMYSNESAAKAARDWYDSHRRWDEELYDLYVSFEEIDTDEIKDEFVPPMTDEEFRRLNEPVDYEI